ncbi:hypothetical protein T4A_9413 [Trichinella pseudospiralis]|uniref:Uncharacterized protein n=1 Tax=Trichinella pseudospiralis TaxID=6337 RepID=A0A0V1E8Y9_TRIPS|nr:hypothetical protein T4A_9413 [Trichinella pseudospiralis]
MRRKTLPKTAAEKSAVERLRKDAEQLSTSNTTDTDTEVRYNLFNRQTLILSNDHIFATSGQCATISFCASSTTDGIYLAPLDVVGSDNSSTVVSLLLPRCGVTALKEITLSSIKEPCVCRCRGNNTKEYNLRPVATLVEYCEIFHQFKKSKAAHSAGNALQSKRSRPVHPIRLRQEKHSELQLELLGGKSYPNALSVHSQLEDRVNTSIILNTQPEVATRNCYFTTRFQRRCIRYDTSGLKGSIARSVSVSCATSYKAASRTSSYSEPAASHQPRRQKLIYHWSANDALKIAHRILLSVRREPQILPPSRKPWVFLEPAVVHAVPGLVPRQEISGTAVDGKMHVHQLGACSLVRITSAASRSAYPTFVVAIRAFQGVALCTQTFVGSFEYMQTEFSHSPLATALNYKAPNKTKN